MQAWIMLLKLLTLRLSEEQVTILLNHGDSPYLRAMGALYVRYCCEPTQLWRWLGAYADDLEDFAPSRDPEARMTFQQSLPGRNEVLGRRPTDSAGNLGREMD